jgi:hypothetical protein
VSSQTAGSFVGRQASAAVAVRSASNFGASRSFVFGSDPSSNHSNPAAAGGGGGDSRGAAPAGGSGAPAGSLGPSSFAGLGKLIAEAQGQGGGDGGAGAPGVLPRASSFGAAAAGAAGGGSKGGGQPGGGSSSMLLSVLHKKKAPAATGLPPNLSKLPSFKAPGSHNGGRRGA